LKQLFPLGNKSVIRHGVDALIAAGISDIVVVCGADRRNYDEALEGSRVQLVVNEALGSEMADSVRLGLQTLAAGSSFSGLLVCLADHPLVQVTTYRSLIRRHHEAPDKIIIPAFKSRRGHPTLFPAQIISDIFFVTSLRDIVREDPGRVLLVDLPDEGVVLDMDTESDYRAARELYDARESLQLSGDGHV